MEYHNYIAKKRARFHAICGDVNIPYGTELTAKDGFLYLDGNPICCTSSQNAYDYFSQNDDGCGEERGKLTTEILKRMSKPGTNHQERWNKIWEDQICQKYKRPEHEDWVWNYDFYNAPTFDLWHIKRLIDF